MAQDIVSHKKSDGENDLRKKRRRDAAFRENRRNFRQGEGDQEYHDGERHAKQHDRIDERGMDLVPQIGFRGQGHIQIFKCLLQISGCFGRLHQAHEGRRKDFGILRERFIERLAAGEVLAHFKKKVPHRRLVGIRDENIDRRQEVGSHAEHEREIFREKNLVRDRDAAAEQSSEATPCLPP